MHVNVHVMCLYYILNIVLALDVVCSVAKFFQIKLFSLSYTCTFCLALFRKRNLFPALSLTSKGFDLYSLVSHIKVAVFKVPTLHVNVYMFILYMYIYMCTIVHVYVCIHLCLS